MKAMKIAGTVIAAVALVASAVATGGASIGLSAAVVSTASTVATVAGITGGVIGLVGALAFKPKFTQQGSQTKFVTNPQSGLPYAIGRTRMSGLRIHADTTDGFPGKTENDILGFGVMLSAGGEIDEIEQFSADGQAISFDAGGNAIGTLHNYMAQKIWMGGAMASALALSLGTASFPGWTVAHKLSGITHALWMLRFETDGSKYGAGVPEPAWIGKWVKVYDPRKDSTYPGGAGSHRALDESTYEWSENGALHALTWALGRWQNSKRTLGIGAPPDNIRIADFVEAANVADANSWKCGGVEWSTDSKYDTLKRMLQSAGAEPTMTGAMIGCRVYAPKIPIATIAAADLLDNLVIATTKPRRDRFNTAIPRFRDEDSEWEVVSGTPVTFPDYVAADGGQRTKELDLPLVQRQSGSDPLQAAQLAAYEIVNSREAGPITFTTGPKWMGLKTGDCIILDVPDEGLDAQPIILKQVSRDPATCKVSFVAETETAGKHALALGKTTVAPPPFSLTPPDLTPRAPLDIEWASSGGLTGEGLPCVTVIGTPDLPGADGVIIDYRVTGDEDWTRSAILSPNGGTIAHVIAPLASETWYEVRVGYRNEGREGDWLTLPAVRSGAGKLSTIEAGATNGATPAQAAQLDAQALALAQLDVDTAAAVAAIASQETTITAMEADVADLGDRVLAAEGEIDAVEIVQATQGASITTLQTTASTQAGEIASIETDLSTANAEIATNASAISGLDASVASLSSTVSSQGAQVSSNTSAIATQDGRLATVETRLTAGGGNLLPNSALVTTDGWSATGGSLDQFDFGRDGAGDDWRPTGEHNLYMHQQTGNEGPWMQWHVWTGANGRMSATGSAWYEFSAWLAAHRVQWMELRIEWYDSAGAYITTSYSGGFSDVGTGGTNINAWTRKWMKVQAPANAAMCTPVWIRASTVPGEADSWAWMTRPMLREVTADFAGPSGYAPSNNISIVEQQAQALSTLTSNYASVSTTVSIQGVAITDNIAAIGTISGNVTTLFGRAALTVDVNGSVSGYEINNNGTVSNFKILATRFQIVDGSGSGDVPFEVVGGVTRIKTASIGDATIGTLKIANGAITNITYSSGTNTMTTGYSVVATVTMEPVSGDSVLKVDVAGSFETGLGATGGTQYGYVRVRRGTDEIIPEFKVVTGQGVAASFAHFAILTGITGSQTFTIEGRNQLVTPSPPVGEPSTVRATISVTEYKK